MKSYIYSFGVVLLETLTGRRESEFHFRLVKWASPINRAKNKLIDPRLGPDYPLESALEYGALALTCVALDGKDRPSSEEVLMILEQIYMDVSNTTLQTIPPQKHTRQTSLSAFQLRNNHPPKLGGKGKIPGPRELLLRLEGKQGGIDPEGVCDDNHEEDNEGTGCTVYDMDQTDTDVNGSTKKYLPEVTFKETRALLADNRIQVLKTQILAELNQEFRKISIFLGVIAAINVGKVKKTHIINKNCSFMAVKLEQKNKY
ncbi:hypothetical protein LXL04_027619 [Taraxacum kok-saghyz]